MKRKFSQSTRNVLNILLVVVLGLALLWGKSSGETGIPENEATIMDMLTTEADKTTVPEETVPEKSSISEDGTYTTKEEVAEYINLYGHLPSNFITKREAKELGWVNSEGNLNEVAPGMSIGGDYFGNYEGLLPEADGRKYTECDVNYEGGYRGAERIIFSDDGDIYYTGDHYKSFEQLY